MNNDIHELGGTDPRHVLGVHRGAGRDDIVRAFRRKVRHGGHPDTGGDRGTFDRLSLARDVLLDPARLAAYEAAARPAGQVPRPSTTVRQQPSTARSTAHAPGPTAAPASTAPVGGHRAGPGGSSVVPVLLLLSYFIVVPILLRVLLVLVP